MREKRKKSSLYRMVAVASLALACTFTYVFGGDSAKPRNSQKREVIIETGDGQKVSVRAEYISKKEKYLKMIGVRQEDEKIVLSVENIFNGGESRKLRVSGYYDSMMVLLSPSSDHDMESKGIVLMNVLQKWPLHPGFIAPWLYDERRVDQGHVFPEGYRMSDLAAITLEGYYQGPNGVFEKINNLGGFKKWREDDRDRLIEKWKNMGEKWEMQYSYLGPKGEEKIEKLRRELNRQMKSQSEKGSFQIDMREFLGLPCIHPETNEP